MRQEDGLQQGTYYINAERDLNELATYYNMPSLSVKSCCYEAMLQAVPGFQVGYGPVAAGCTV